MKLSEAILLGALMKPQGFGPSGYPQTSCGLQAGLDALGISERESVYAAAAKIWPWLDRNVECPWCAAEHTVGDVIGTHLNDRAKWSRDRIAAWVATIEPQDEVITQPQQITQQQEVSA